MSVLQPCGSPSSPGSGSEVVGAALVYRGHIYVPVGTISMLCLAAGFFIPRWIVQALWRRQKARHDMD